jgi:hypothetical protein
MAPPSGGGTAAPGRAAIVERQEPSGFITFSWETAVSGGSAWLLPYPISVAAVTPKKYFLQEGTTMLATVEQTTVDLPASPALDQATLPTLTYDMVNHQVAITVIVSRLESGSLGFATPPIVIKRPRSGSKRDWTLAWSFQPDYSLMGHGLPNFSIRVPANGATLPFGPSPYSTGPSEWIIPLDPMGPTEPIEPNNLGLFAFGYDIVASDPIKVLEIHDPTIVVTPDPIT